MVSPSFTMEASINVTTASVSLKPGTCDWHAGEDWRAKAFRVVMRSPRDVTVLRAGPWWNLQKLLWIVGILAAVVLGAFAAGL